jgi:hypothetical protein
MSAIGTIVIRVQWNIGGSLTIRTDSTSPIGDVLASHGFESSLTFSLVIVFKGQIIDPMFSFHYYHINSGDRLICMAKKTGIDPKIVDYLDQFSISSSRTSSLTFQQEDIRENVQSKLEDVVFTRWELLNEFPRMLRELLDEYEQMDAPFEEERLPTVMPDHASVNEAPMPTSWPGNELSRTLAYSRSSLDVQQSSTSQ